MKKRGIFSLVVLLALSTLLAAQTTTTDIGTAYELVISDVAFAQAETNNSSSVSVITRAQIEAYNAQTTADLVNKAIGASFNSKGGLGTLQTVTIRGAGSSKNLVFLDGVLLSSAHEGTVDLSVIPVSTIERIEIIKSGSGNLGRTNAIGGMVNIITKKGEPTERPFTLSVENGSFLPEAYGTPANRNWLSLLDNQKLDVTYANTLGGTNLLANIGGFVAQNAYTYEGFTTKMLKEDSQVYAIHGGVNVGRAFGENIDFSSDNLANYQHLTLPSYSANQTDNQRDILLSTKNSVTLSTTGENLERLKADLNYSYDRKFYHPAGSTDSIHNKNKGNFLVEGTWNLGETYNIVTGADLAFDYVDSTDIGKQLRFTPVLYTHASIYLLAGALSLHPSANISYLSDRTALSPNASFGAVYNLNSNNTFKANLSYAENPPTFSELYWPLLTWLNPDGSTGSYAGNSNLKTEKGLQADIGYSTKLEFLTYEGTIFARNIYNAIMDDYSIGKPNNIAHSVYFGTEQAVVFNLNDMVTLSASYQFNKSYDLSNGQTFTDNVEVEYVRMHTAKASASFAYNIFDAVLSGEFLDESKGLYGKADPAFILNLSFNAQVTEDLKVYVAVDNLLNASYELSGGYPMPGTKIRLGGTLQF